MLFLSKHLQMDNTKQLEEIQRTLRAGINSGGFTTLVKLTGAQIGVSGAAYATGDVLGDTSPIAVEVVRGKNGTGILQSLIIQDLSKQSIALDMVVFDSNPTATTFTDNSALDIADVDLPRVIGVVKIESTDYAAFNDSSVATKTGAGLVLQNYSDLNKVWVCFVTRGAPTYVADELSAVIGILQD